MSIKVTPFFPVFTDADGQPLENGKLYVGSPNVSTVANQIQVYWDPELTLPAAQPITTIGGYPSNNGTPTPFYTDQNYSLLVQNKNGVQVYAVADVGASDSANVKSFGAAGDGVTDDTVAIEKALEASNNVYFPEGLYLTTKALRLTGSKRIFGDGKGVSRVIRYDTTPETINAVSVTATVYMSNRYNSIENMGIRGDRTGTDITASVDGVFFGNLNGICSNSALTNVDIRNAQNCIYADTGVFMMTFNQVNCANSVNAYNFSDTSAKTSLTFNSCWAENVGQAWDFYAAYYITLNSCGADYANYTSGTGTAGPNPYGFGFGSQSTGKGVYHFVVCNVTLNTCGAEYSYGDGVFGFGGSCTAVLNGPHQSSCSSEYVPDYVSYGDVAVGPIQADPAGNVNTLTINSPSLTGWTNPAVSTGYPTRPISQVLAYNYSEAIYGVKTGTRAFITASVYDDADIIKGIGSAYCSSANEVANLNILPGRVQRFTRRLEMAGDTTATATITFPASVSWSPVAVSVKASCAVNNDTPSGLDGTASSFYGLRLLDGVTAVANDSTDILTSTSISLAPTYGTLQLIVTATVASNAGMLLWFDIETTTYENGDVSIAYATA